MGLHPLVHPQFCQCPSLWTHKPSPPLFRALGLDETWHNHSTLTWGPGPVIGGSLRPWLMSQLYSCSQSLGFVRRRCLWKSRVHCLVGSTPSRSMGELRSVCCVVLLPRHVPGGKDPTEWHTIFFPVESSHTPSGRRKQTGTILGSDPAKC